MASPAWTSDEIWSKPTFFKCLVVCLHDANAKKSGSFLMFAGAPSDVVEVIPRILAERSFEVGKIDDNEAEQYSMKSLDCS